MLHRDGPLLILAGAGSGKTSTMAHRIAHLVSHHSIPAGRILGLSFTNKAALELRERVKRMLKKSSGQQASKGLTISTFHSLCVKILREQAEVLGYTKNFTILDQNDQSDIVKQILRHIKLDDRKFDPDWIRFEIGQAKNRFMGPDEAQAFFLESGRMKEDYAIITASVFTRYQEQLKALNAMDFDDLLFQAVTLLEKNEPLKFQYSRRYQYILVDEYQDTNPAQFRLLEALTSMHKNLCVVGDDDQSIYSWRGAEPEHILRFAEYYPDAKTITLEQNYRSTQTILDAANQVIGQNRKRHAKKLWSDKGDGEPLQLKIVEDDRAEAEIVADEILALSTSAEAGQITKIRRWKDFAILYRSNAQSRVFEDALRMRRIPYTIVGGMSFLERKEIKDFLSYLRLVVNPKDDASMRRVLNWPARGIGKTSIETLTRHSIQNQTTFFEACQNAETLVPKTAAAISKFLHTIDAIRHSLFDSPATPQGISLWARKLIEQLELKRAVEEECDDPAQFARKWENVEEMVHALGQLSIKDLMGEDSTEEATPIILLREYLSRLTLDAQEEEDKEDDKKEKDEVILLTLHGAKGMEYPVVFLVGLEEGLLPHQRSLDESTDLSEERRLCYVGITRAKERLILTRAQTRIRYGKAVPRNPSRFLAEIPENLVLVENLAITQFSSAGTIVPAKTQAAEEKHEEMVKNFLGGIRARLQENSKKPGL